jgi:phosphoglycolate phosphatase-like HAD superfamily hydrolase
VGANVVFLFDVDNTLLDNDRVSQDLRDHLNIEYGAEARDRYMTILEGLRDEHGYVDYLGAIQRWRLDNMDDPRVPLLSQFLIHYPFERRAFPGAIEVLERLDRVGRTVVLTDGDVVFQPRKVRRAGIWDAVDGRVLIFINKEKHLDDVERFYPADRYVLIDDKLRIHAAVKPQWGEKVTTVFVRQGHYAHDEATIAAYPPADVTIDRIDELLTIDPAKLTGG